MIVILKPIEVILSFYRIALIFIFFATSEAERSILFSRILFFQHRHHAVTLSFSGASDQSDASVSYLLKEGIKGTKEIN